MTRPAVLVTGATGFIGGHLCRRLVAEGHRVRALVRRPERADALGQAGVEIVPGDITDPAAVGRAARGVDTVFHLAGVFREEAVSDATFQAVNVGGVGNVLEAAAAHGVRRVVHCSTTGVVGDPRPLPATEDAPYQHLGYPYQESKVAGEQLARQYADRGPTEVVVARPCGVYGPGDLRFLKLFRALQRRRFVMIGSGANIFHPTYIDDLVDGLRLCGSRPEARGRVYYLAGPEYAPLERFVALVAEAVGTRPPRWRIPVRPVYALGHLCELIFKPLGIEPPLYRRRVEFFMLERAFDIGRAVRELGYAPQVDLTTGLARTAAWYRQQGYL